MKLKDVRGYVPPYPTMTEIGKRAAISYYTPMTRKPFVRWIVRFSGVSDEGHKAGTGP
jgi:hypothetical protein